MRAVMRAVICTAAIELLLVILSSAPVTESVRRDLLAAIAAESFANRRSGSSDDDSDGCGRSDGCRRDDLGYGSRNDDDDDGRGNSSGQR